MGAALCGRRILPGYEALIIGSNERKKVLVHGVGHWDVQAERLSGKMLTLSDFPCATLPLEN
jgi:hypothetical protein